MSYNIDSVEVISGGDMRMRAADVRRLAPKMRDANQLPELDPFFEAGLINKANAAVDFPGAEVKVEKLWWSGLGSGATFEHFKTVLSALRGRVDLLITWEGGDSFTGLRVIDGKVTEMDVEFVLVPKKKRG